MHIANLPLDLGPDDQLGALSRKLDALQTRGVPLAIAASQHLRRQLQAAEVKSGSRGGEAVAVHPTAMMTERERDVLLEEMRTLQRLLTMARPGGGGAGRSASPGGGLLPPHSVTLGMRHVSGVRHVGGSQLPAHSSGHNSGWASDLGGMDAAGSGANEPGHPGGVTNLGMPTSATGFGEHHLGAAMGLNDGIELIDADDAPMIGNDGLPDLAAGGLFGMVDSVVPGHLGSTHHMGDRNPTEEDEEEEDGGMLVDGDDMVGDDALGAMLGREIAREEGQLREFAGGRAGDAAGGAGDRDGPTAHEPMDDAVPRGTIIAGTGDDPSRDGSRVVVPLVESPYGTTSSKKSKSLRDGDQTDDEDEEDDEDLSTGVAA